MKQEIKDYECPYCHKHFNITRGGLSCHIKYCEANPKSKENKENDKKRGAIRRNRLIEERKKTIKERKLICKECGKEYILMLSDFDFDKHYYSDYCSRRCSNMRHHGENVIQKIKENTKNSEKYKNHLEKIRKQKEHKENELKKNIYNKVNRYFCGSKELDEQNYDISRRQSPKWFKKLIPFGLDINTLYTPQIIEEHKKVKELLYNEYVINGLSPADIYSKYNCKEYFNNSETLLHVFKDWEFPIRSYSKAVINEWLQGKQETGKDPYHYKQQWYITWNGKEVYLHSSYELDYAKELDAQHIDYEVEFFHIKYWDSQKHEYRCAVPDFYIPSTNTIVEIKSNYTLDKQNMIDRKKAYIDLGYNFKLICEHKELEI